jgi:transposase
MIETAAEDEPWQAAREFVRAREDARTDLMRARHRLSKLLLRQGLVWPKSACSRQHGVWLNQLSFSYAPLMLSFDEAHWAVQQATSRRDRLHDSALVGIVGGSL